MLGEDVKQPGWVAAGSVVEFKLPDPPTDVREQRNCCLGRTWTFSGDSKGAALEGSLISGTTNSPLRFRAAPESSASVGSGFTVVGAGVAAVAPAVGFVLGLAVGSAWAGTLAPGVGLSEGAARSASAVSTRGRTVSCPWRERSSVPPWTSPVEKSMYSVLMESTFGAPVVSCVWVVLVPSTVPPARISSCSSLSPSANLLFAGAGAEGSWAWRLQPRLGPGPAGLRPMTIPGAVPGPQTASLRWGPHLQQIKSSLQG